MFTTDSNIWRDDALLHWKPNARMIKTVLNNDSFVVLLEQETYIKYLR